VEPEQEHRFIECDQAIAALNAYVAALHSAAAGSGRDQAVPIEVFRLQPRRPAFGPLLLIGGMGPLAGAEGFLRACRRFGDRRVLVLFQACSVPDRTAAILAAIEGRAEASIRRRELVTALVSALAAGAAACPDSGPLACVVLCNSAHYFLAEACAELATTQPRIAARLRLHSLIRGVVAKLVTAKPKRILLATTTGTLRGQLYSGPLAEAGVAQQVPDEDLQEILMEAIYAGVKGGDRQATLRAGSRFFSAVMARYPEVDALLAGCTEIPTILAEVSGGGAPRLKSFLAGTTCYDPVELVLGGLDPDFPAKSG